MGSVRKRILSPHERVWSPLPRRGPVLIVLCVMGLFLTTMASGQQALPDLTHPLSVDELVRIGLSRNLELAQTKENIRAARGAYLSTFSGLLPSLTAGYSYQRQVSNSFAGISYYDPQLQRTVTLGGNHTAYYYTFGSSLYGQVNLANLPSWYSNRGAAHGYQASRYAFSDSRSATALAIRQQYYALIEAQEIAKVDEDAFALAQDQQKRAESLFQLGSVAKADVLQAQVNVATNDRDRIAAENSIDQERARLAVLLGLPVDAPVLVADPPPISDSLFVPQESDLLQQAMKNRPDLHQAQENLHADQARERASKSQRYPSIGANYSYGKDRPFSDEVLSEFDRDYRLSVTIGVSLNVFDGLQTKGAIQQAIAARRAQEEVVGAKNLQVALDVRVAMIQIKNASEEIRAARQGVSSAEESVRLQKALYESGGGTLLEWNNAQVDLTKAREAQVQAEVDLRLAQAALAKALGQDFE